jgi:hypothetical protein
MRRADGAWILILAAAGFVLALSFLGDDARR